MAETTSDPPGRRERPPNLPPPPAPEDPPSPVSVPRMEPPPSSLGAMVQNRTQPVARDSREVSPWLILLLLVVAGVAATIYLYN